MYENVLPMPAGARCGLSMIADCSRLRRRAGIAATSHCARTPAPIARITAGLLLCMVTAGAAQICGDCNRSGTVTITDALRAAQFSAGILIPIAADFDVCDTDSSSAITIIDALRMAQIAVGLAPAVICPGGAPNDPPVVTMVSVPPGSFGDVLVSYRLQDTESNTCNIVVCLSTDGGATFPQVATETSGGDGRTSLTSSPAGVIHVFAWDSLVDLGATLRVGVVLRIGANDPQPGPPGDSAPFSIDNRGFNQAPIASAVAPLGAPPLSGNVTFSYSISDAESDPVSITVAYSTNSGSTFQAATDGPGGDGRVSLATSPGGTPHAYVWNSTSDLGATLQMAVVLRITPMDAQSGTPAMSSVIVIDNRPPNTPPTVSGVLPAMPHSGNIVINYLLSDAQSDMAQIAVAISTNGGSSFLITATDGPGGDGRVGLSSSPGGTPHTYRWNSVADLGAVLQPSVIVRITPMDALTGTPGLSAGFSVDNRVMVSFSMHIQPTILSTTPGGMGCVSCHGSAGGLNLMTYTSMMAGGFSGPVVVPGSPGTSRIICKLSGTTCGSRMPIGGTVWTPALIQTFRDWITQGALNN